MNMSSNKLLFLILHFELQLIWSQITIPQSLRECYRINSTLNSQLPFNLRIMVDIIQKLERYSYTTMDLRLMSLAILHRFKLDGVEYQKDVKILDKILPFSATGIQRIKHKLIEELIPNNVQPLPVHVLSQTERCIFHQAISNTILKFDAERNNETCRIALTNRSNYPIQKGVVLTPYGTIAPGAIIGAIAASLQYQNVTMNQLITNLETPLSEINFTNIYNLKYNEEEIDFVLPKSKISHEQSMWYNVLMTSPMKIDNIWLTTIAGELAEVVVYQGPLVGLNVTLGATGFWHNKLYPSTFYLTSSHTSFYATRAELIGGIDGMIIANNIQTWIQDFYSLRLSQILEMYYSYEGIAFNTNIRACNRKQYFLYAVPKTILNEQTYAIAKMLAYRKSIAYISPEALQKMVEYTTDKFYTYAETTLFPELTCQEITRSQVEALVVFDGAWSIEYTTNILTLLIQNMDVSMYGSKIGIIHGTSGAWLLNITNSPSFAYEVLNNFTNISWPMQLNYTKVLNTIFTYLNRTWENNRRRHIVGNLGQVVILLTPWSYMSYSDKKLAMTMLHQIKYHHPDVHFVYYSSRSNINLFKSFILSNEDYLIKNSNINAIIQHVSTIPKMLRPVSLDLRTSKNFTPQFEDYISPSKSIIYKMHSKWRQNMKNILITIHNFGYGTINVCSWIQFRMKNKDNFQCTELTGYKEITLTETFNYVTTSSCPNFYVQVQNATSLYKCAEIECKTPDQIRFIIRMNQRNSQYGSSANKNVLIFLNFLILFIFRMLI